MKRSLLLVIGCAALAPLPAVAQTPPAPAPTPAPAPAPKFNSGSPLDGIRNEAWSKLEEITDAYEQCDAERFERALDELEQLRQRAKASADAARAAPEFRTVKPEEADGLADTLADQIRQRRYLLDALKRECSKQHRPGAMGTLVGPRRAPAQTTPQPQTAPPAAQPATDPQATEDIDSVLDDVEEEERLERERKKAERARRESAQGAATQPPAQGLSEAEQKAAAEKLEEAEKIEEAVRDIEGDEWLHQEVRADVLRRVRENLLQDKRFPPDSIQRWVERLNRVWDSLSPEAKAAAEKPLGPVRSTTLPMEFPPMPKPAPSTGPQTGLPKDTRVDLNPQEQLFLALHNQARAEVGARPLQWDPALAASAKAYAIELTSAGQLVHSSREGRKTVRENLLQNLPGGRTPAQMIGVWTAEKSKFKPGIFPDVSTTGNWYDIGHYTQMVWETTTHVGCAINGDARFEWLVCHYSPPGNRDGTAIGLPAAPQPRHVVASKPPMPQLRGAAGQDGIAPANSTTTTAPPPPPPPPTARDDAPDGDEARHPLNGYFAEAMARHATAVDCGDRAAAAAELVKMRYALDELKKRLKAAKKAGPYSAVKPDDVQKQIDDMEAKIRSAELRPGPGACPPMPQPRGVAGQSR